MALPHSTTYGGGAAVMAAARAWPPGLALDARSPQAGGPGSAGADDEAGLSWTAERLRTYVQTAFPGERLFVLANREPLIHERAADGGIRARQPASGVVTALEPLMRACNGVWIAHGSGSADRDVVDARDGVAVRPTARSYRLRRLWLSAEEERGYYYGFANEALWPLCHLAHVRPMFRAPTSAPTNRQPAIRRRDLRGGRRPIADRAGPGLSLRVRAAR